MPSLVPKDAAFVTTDLIYSTVTGGKKPFQWINPPPVGTPLTNMDAGHHDWNITDLRSPQTDQDDFGLDKSGFAAVVSPSSMAYADWTNEEIIKSKYYVEVEALLKKQTGAHKVTIFDHTIRRQTLTQLGVEDTPETRQPVSRVHVDQTPESAIRRVRRHDPDQAEDLLKGRVQLINIWRPLRGPVQDVPLAVADYRSLSTPADFTPCDLIYSPEQIGETFVVNHNPQHKWYYLSEMQPSEALLLKCYDSASTVNNPLDGIAALTPHTAFQDSRYFGKPGVEPRESIELRALVYSN